MASSAGRHRRELPLPAPLPPIVCVVMRHEILPRSEPRPITPRRLQASARALWREQDNHPLFAKQIAEEQPMPDERLVQIEATQVEH